MSASTGQPATQQADARSGLHRADLPVEDPTVGRLVADASAQVSTLLRSEIALAKSELKVSVTAGGIGAALLAVAGFLLVLGIVMASIAFAYLLVRLGLPPDLSFLVVFGVYALLALILALLARGRFKKVSGPQRTIDTTKETVATLRRR